MDDKINVPDWMKRHIDMARKVFGVQGPEWRFDIAMADKLERDGEQLRGTSQSSPYHHNAYIRFSEDESVKDDIYGMSTIYHEVLHISMGRINLFVESLMRDIPDSGVRQKVQDEWECLNEEFVSRITRNVVEVLVQNEASYRAITAFSDPQQLGETSNVA